MSLFDDASLVISPNGTKAGKLYAVKPTDGSGDLTVTRATSATRVNASGLIETVSANVPRLDYSNGTCPSILVEPQRTNILLNSETLATQSVTVTSQPYTLSFYGSGTIVLSGTHSATVVGLGTARKNYTFTPTAGTLTLTVTGTCTKGQLEAGSYATSYIPTTSASVTRNADVISKTGISSLIGQTEGTMFIDINYKADSVFKNFFNLGTSTSSYIAIVARSNNKIGAEVLNAGVQVNTEGSTIYTSQRLKIAFAYKANDFAMYINGVLAFSQSSGTVPAKAEVYLGSYGNGSWQPKDGINSAALWKTRLSNTELATLTTI